eukprot:Filipodium_phascolosomae@DN2176_c0_g1_i3.p1
MKNFSGLTTKAIVDHADQFWLRVALGFGASVCVGGLALNLGNVATFLGRHSYIDEALKSLEERDEIVSVTGRPLHPGIFKKGSILPQNRHGYSTFRAVGPKGSMMVHATADMTDTDMPTLEFVNEKRNLGFYWLNPWMLKTDLVTWARLVFGRVICFGCGRTFKDDVHEGVLQTLSVEHPKRGVITLWGNPLSHPILQMKILQPPNPKKSKSKYRFVFWSSILAIIVGRYHFSRFAMELRKMSALEFATHLLKTNVSLRRHLGEAVSVTSFKGKMSPTIISGKGSVKAQGSSHEVRIYAERPKVGHDWRVYNLTVLHGNAWIPLEVKTSYHPVSTHWVGHLDSLVKFLPNWKVENWKIPTWDESKATFGVVKMWIRKLVHLTLHYAHTVKINMRTEKIDDSSR